MARPKLKDGYLRIVNELYEQFFIRDFSIIQLRILLLLMRYSYGCNKKTAIIKPQNLLNLAYVYECDIKREVQHLERNKVITCNFENKTFALNKNFDEWKIPFHKLFNEQKLEKLLQINLCSQQSENFADNKEIEEEKVCSGQTTLPTTKKILCSQQSENFADNKETSLENSTVAIDTTTPKDNIKTYKDNNINNTSIYKEGVGVSLPKNFDPYFNNPLTEIFKKTYMEILKKDECHLDNFKINKLTELRAEHPVFFERLPEILTKYSKITFPSGNKPGTKWLILEGNWAGILNGEYDQYIKDEETSEQTYDRKDGWDL